MRAAARAVLEENWRPQGFTCPNGATYPWLWLWDSCFHSIVWAELGAPDRAVQELRTALSAQDGDGFVPHLLYLDGSDVHAELWGRQRTSSITQPPIYGLTVAELAARDVVVPAEVVEQATAGLWFLLERRRRSPAGLIELVHPWESGCDHSPRWDDLMGPEPGWIERKGELLGGIERSAGGAPLRNDDFPVGSVAFTAMTAFCARRLAAVTGDPGLGAAGDELVQVLRDRWDPTRRTFVDDGPTATGSGRIRTAEALLGVLVVDDAELHAAVHGELTDIEALGGAMGPAQVHRDEPSYRPGSYWRGPSWPQLDYLLWLGLGRPVSLGRAVADGAVTSGWAEYWDPDDARPGGACPQSWTTLAVCMHEKL